MISPVKAETSFLEAALYYGTHQRNRVPGAQTGRSVDQCGAVAITEAKGRTGTIGLTGAVCRMPDTAFTLVRASKSRGGDWWSPDDYDVRDKGERVIGRIMLHPQAPKDQPWFWTITALEVTPSVYNKGYAESREQAMADFRAQWERAASFKES